MESGAIGQGPTAIPRRHEQLYKRLMSDPFLEVAKPDILKVIPKAGEAHPAAVNYNGGVIYTCVPQHKFRCLKVRGDNYSEISKAWGTKRTRQQAWKECIDAVDAHHACHQPKKGKAK